MSDREKERGAMRILEALGAADEVLLAQCEDDAPVKRRIKVMPLLRYGGVAAACVCLLAAGGLAFGIMQPKGASEGMDATAQYAAGALDGGAPDLAEDYGEAPATDAAWGMADAGEGVSDPADSEAGLGTDDTDAEMAAEPGDPEEILGDAADAVAQKEYAERLGGLAEYPLTEEEARSFETLSGYLPVQLPQGYVFEAAWHYGAQQDNVSMTWVREGEYLTVSAYLVEDPGQLETVDADATEQYDRRLDSVLESEKAQDRVHQGLFWDPIFDSEDISLEVARCRMVSWPDAAGEEQTPQGDLSVLYPEGILLHIAGSATPEEIWELLCGLEEGRQP